MFLYLSRYPSQDLQRDAAVVRVSDKSEYYFEAAILYIMKIP